MKKVIVILIAGLMLLASCVQEPQSMDGLGYVGFSQEPQSKDVYAGISYPVAENLLWTIEAVKQDNHSTIGEGIIEGALLTDTFGPYSIGKWSFSLKGYDGEKLVYEGSATATIGEGHNNVRVVVTPHGETGTLRVAGSNIPNTGYNGADILVDGERLMEFSYASLRLNTERNYYELEEQSIEVPAGIHDIVVRLHEADYEVYTSFKLRIKGGLTTTLTFGTFEGSVGLTVIVDEEDAIVEEL